MTRGWSDRERFTQEGLLAERRIAPPRRRAAASERESARAAGADGPARGRDPLDGVQRAELHDLGEHARGREQRRHRPAAEPRECA